MRRLAIIAGAIAVIAGGCGDDSTTDAGDLPVETTETSAEPVTTAAGPTTTAVAEPVEISIARAQIDAWNSGDLDGYISFFGEDAVVIKSEWSITNEYVLDGFEYWIALGDELSLEACEVLADGRVACQASGTNDLSGPAGVVTESEQYFWFEDGLIVRVSSTKTDLDDFWFHRDMQLWLEEVHPDVWEDTFLLAELCNEMDSTGYNCRETWRATAETAAALLEYGPEFIAQSNKYPLGG